MKLYQIDAFVGLELKGNPAAVCPLNQWIDEQIMQDIAEENNLSETAFFVPQNDGTFAIRWFTPAAEVNLCGHATMAAAYVIFNELGYQKDVINFSSKSGKLIAKKIADKIEIDLPQAEFEEIPYDQNLEKALGKSYSALYRAGEDYLVIFADENDVINLTPNFNLLKTFKVRGVVISASVSDIAKDVAKDIAKDIDFISRAFFPRLNVDEDPVTGSAHTHLVPYWSKKLSKNILHAKQVSPRGGELFCKLEKNRVLLAGKCNLYLRGDIFI